MDAISSCRNLLLNHSLCSITKIKTPNSSLPPSQNSRPNFGLRCRDFALPRSSLLSFKVVRKLRISYRRNEGLQQCSRARRISCKLGDNNEDSQQEASIDLKLPRRSLLVTFTCDACGARSQRLINRLAYERGLVYVQCSGCAQYHKLVDNLGLVIEYNLQEEIDLSANTDQV